MKGIQLDETGEIIIERDGAYHTMKIGDVDSQIAEHVITAFQGEYKEIPLLGGNIKKMLNGAPDPFWVNDVKRQLKNQGLNAELTVTDTQDIIVTLK
jgi:hypothetical protein